MVQQSAVMSENKDAQGSALASSNSDILEAVVSFTRAIQKLPAGIKDGRSSGKC